MIILDENYRIETDSNNVTLVYSKEKEVTVKNKETKQDELKTVTEKNEWHYPNFKGALKKYLNESLKKSETIEDIISGIAYVENKIDNLKL